MTSDARDSGAPPVLPGAARSPEIVPGDLEWADMRGGRTLGIALLMGPRPDVVFADAATVDTAARLAAWHGAPLLVDLRGSEPSAVKLPALRRARRVIVADDAQQQACVTSGVEAGRLIRIVPGGSAGDPARGPVDEVGSLSDALAEAKRLAVGRGIPFQPAGTYRFFKRAMDLAVGLLLSIVLVIPLLLVAILIRLDSPGPALFRQRRIGRGTSEFTIMKFRTMRTGTPDLASHLVGPGSSRVTRLGRLLRRASIDELPQLWHLVNGEMSLVGPRPALHNQYDLIGMRQAVGVDALKPGVTGWAQVNGRDDIPLERKVEYDRHYLEHVSAARDIAIILRTVVVLFSDRGTY